MPATRVTRVHAYIDGWNFYCAINEPRRLRYGWCDFTKLADALSLKRFGEKARLVKYFNTPVAEQPIRGRLKKDSTSITKRREKEADVHLAVDMLSDAPQYDAALLLSADTDFRPLIRKLAGCLGKTIVVCYLEKGQGNPETDPGIPKWEKQLISDSLLEACRLPNDIRDPQTGEIIRWDHYLALKGGRFPSSRR
jgi:uncharacterized LabA/DUF88 family protein